MRDRKRHPSHRQRGGATPARDADSVYSAIKTMITDGSLRSGAAVSQLQLTRMLGVSRTPIREALRRLQAEGLLEAERNRRMRVAGLTPSDLDAIYSTRIFLESMGVALTVPLLTAEDRADLKAASKAIVWDQADPQAHDRQLSRFKLLIMKYSGDGILAAIAEQFDRCERVRKIYQSVAPSGHAVAHEEHNALLDACLRGATDEAVFIASRHLGRTALAVIGYLAPDYEPRAVRLALAQTGRNLSVQTNSSVLKVVNHEIDRNQPNKNRDRAIGE